MATDALLDKARAFWANQTADTFIHLTRAIRALPQDEMPQAENLLCHDAFGVPPPPRVKGERIMITKPQADAGISVTEEDLILVDDGRKWGKLPQAELFNKVKEVITRASFGYTAPRLVALICAALADVFSGQLDMGKIKTFKGKLQTVNASSFGDTPLGRIPLLSEIGSAKDFPRKVNEFRRVLAACNLAEAHEELVGLLAGAGWESDLKVEAARIRELMRPGAVYNPAVDAKLLIAYYIWRNFDDVDRRVNQLTTWLQVGNVIRTLTMFGKATIVFTKMPWADLTQISQKSVTEAMAAVDTLPVRQIFAPFNAIMAREGPFKAVRFKKEQESLEMYFQRLSNEA